MGNSNILYLASQSQSRKLLLKSTKIPFQIINQNSNEYVDSTLSLDEQVRAIALHKMDNIISSSFTSQIVYVLTADTMAADFNGIIYGKPQNIEDAKAKIRALRKGSYVSTAFCLDKKIFENDAWHTLERIIKVVKAFCIFNVPESDLDYYIAHTPALSATGGITIENYGMQFLETVEGSYTTILGLPLYEVRQALTSMGFFER